MAAKMTQFRDFESDVRVGSEGNAFYDDVTHPGLLYIRSTPSLCYVQIPRLTTIYLLLKYHANAEALVLSG